MFKRWIALTLALTLYMPARAWAADGAEAVKSSLEFFALNREGRVLIHVQVWGDVGLAGTHHIPDNTTLTGLIGYTGGLKGSLEDAKVTIRREGPPDSNQVEQFVVTGEDLMSASKQGAMLMKTGDVVYVQTAPPGELTLRRLTLISTIVGIVSSLLLTYFLISNKK